VILLIWELIHSRLEKVEERKDMATEMVMVEDWELFLEMKLMMPCFGIKLLIARSYLGVLCIRMIHLIILSCKT
jgi:hypothetical protein